MQLGCAHKVDHEFCTSTRGWKIRHGESQERRLFLGCVKKAHGRIQAGWGGSESSQRSAGISALPAAHCRTAKSRKRSQLPLAHYHVFLFDPFSILSHFLLFPPVLRSVLSLSIEVNVLTIDWLLTFNKLTSGKTMPGLCWRGHNCSG